MSQLHAARRFSAVLFVLVLAASCREGGARSYSLDEVVVSARVDRDGSLWIDETRTYTYDGRYSWAEFRLPLDRVGRVSDFSLTEGGRAFTPGADDAPGTYQLESSDEELHVRWHYAAEDETRSFRLRYRVGDAVDLHADVAELYYQFVGVINPQAIGRVAWSWTAAGRPVFEKGGRGRTAVARPRALSGCDRPACRSTIAAPRPQKHCCVGARVPRFRR